MTIHMIEEGTTQYDAAVERIKRIVGTLHEAAEGHNPSDVINALLYMLSVRLIARYETRGETEAATDQAVFQLRQQIKELYGDAQAKWPEVLQ